MDINEIKDVEMSDNVMKEEVQEKQGQEMEVIDFDWQPKDINYTFSDYKKSVKKAEKRKNTGKFFAVVVCGLLFSLAFSIGLVIASKFFSNAVQEGKFSFGVNEEAESKASSEKLETIADIVEDVSKSTVIVYPSSVEFGSDESYGTGIICAEKGNLLYIVTCYHLVNYTNNVSVSFNGSSRYVNATIRGYDVETDLCVLYVNKSDMNAEELASVKICSFGDSEALSVGDLAIVIGNPYSLEYEGSVSVGVISAANRSISKLNETQTSGVTYVLIQTDAAVNPGDSGAPLVNGRGEVIGICNYYVDDVDSEGMGFACAIHKAIPVIESIISVGYMPRPYLGIVGYSASDWSYSEYFGIEYGAVVSNVTEDGPADKAGIISYDVIISFAGVEVHDFDELKEELAKHNVGDTVDVVVYRFYEQEEPANITLKFTLLDKYADKE